MYLDKNRMLKKTLKENFSVLEPARLDVHNISVSYGSRKAIENMSFSINHGERVAVIGPNGAGKSTLFKALIGLISPESGKIFIHGQPLGHHFDCVAFIPQREEVDWTFPVTIRDVVQMGRYNSRRRFKRITKDDDDMVLEAMVQMDILELADRPIGDLSGGQQQRAFIARALAQKPHVMLMDEPFNGVDVVTQELIWELLDKLTHDKVTIMIATHDLNLASQKFNNVMLINKKMIAFGEPAKVFTKDNLEAAYENQVIFIGNNAVTDHCCPKEIE
jgi:manganese/iron transport system ATP-binding protein